MAKFVKKVGSKKYYEIDNIRAAGILPYMIKNNKVYVLINLEERNKKIVYNCIGGKVDKEDCTIFETMIREFNEETGYLVSDKLRVYKSKINKKDCIKLNKSKYLLNLHKINNDKTVWNNLPYNYEKIFDGVEKFNHRESLKLKWVDLFNFNINKNTSFLLKALFYKVRSLSKFNCYDPNQEVLSD